MKYITALRFALMCVIIFIASIYLPDFYWKANKHERNKTNVFYSPILKDFVFIRSDVKQTYYVDGKGKYYSRDEFEQLVPFLNYRQLMVSGKLPASIDGIPLQPKEINLNNITLRVQPAMIQYRPIQLFPLIESASGRLRLELPPDYFRIGSRMEFITSVTNEINEEKSALFTSALIKEGFTFPAKSIYGNPSTKKPFDEGYFVIDDAGKVFHIKMVKGMPYCKNTGIPAGGDIVFILPTENELREFYGMIITGRSEVFFISYDNYKLVSVPVENYNYKEHTLFIKCDLFSRVITVNQENGYYALVTDRSYQVMKRSEEHWPGNDATIAGTIGAFIFPFTIEIERDTTPYVNVYGTGSDPRTLIVSLVALVLAVLYFKKKSVPLQQAAVYCIVVALTGMYGLIAMFVVRDFRNSTIRS